MSEVGRTPNGEESNRKRWRGAGAGGQYLQCLLRKMKRDLLAHRL